MQSSIQIITPARSQSLVTVPEAKLALNLSRSTDEVTQDQIELFIEWSSGEIAAMAGRVFGEETLTETLRDLDSVYPDRIWLSRWPVASIQSLADNATELIVGDYELEPLTGKITCLGGNFSGPVTVTYTGGYKLPADAPSALKQATLLMTRDAYSAAVRGLGTEGVRMISHKETRVIYFDPNARSAQSGAAAAGTPAKRAAADLVKHFMRFPC